MASATNQDKYVRYALTTQLRLALARDDYHEVNEALRALIGDADASRDEDYVYESDFLSDIDESRVDQELLSRYAELT